MKTPSGLKETVLALFIERCAAHIVDSRSGFLASSFRFVIRRVINKKINQ